MDKFLITGISGFVGPNLADLLLDNGHEVHGVIRSTHGRETDLLDILSEEKLSKIQFHYLDLKDREDVRCLLTREKFDGIFHLAAQSHPPTSFLNPILTFDENVNASLNLITHCGDSKFMFSSTSEVYGNQCTESGYLKETDQLMPMNPYACSKAAIDLYLQERMRNKMINAFISRAFSHTGQRRGKNFSISSDAYQIVKIKKGLQEKKLDVGNLNSKRAVLDVRDCVEAYYQLMMCENSLGEIYNVGGSIVHEMKFFTDMLIDIAGFTPTEIELVVSPKLYRPIDINIQRPDITKLLNTVNWIPRYSIQDTLQSLYDYWYRKIPSL